jgi:mono/diheme cytochrome c family protein
LIKKSPMPGYEGKLTREQLGDLVAYLASLRGTP